MVTTVNDIAKKGSGDFSRLVADGPFHGRSDFSVGVYLCTHGPDSHMNIYLYRAPKMFKRGDLTAVTGSEENSVCLSPDGARALRDQLIEAYPLAAAKKAPAPKKHPKGEQEYKGNGKHKWEPVTPDTHRLRVPGGWLYDTGAGVAFVPLAEVIGYKV